MLVAFARFAKRIVIMAGMLGLDADTKLANKFAEPMLLFDLDLVAVHIHMSVQGE